MQILRILYIYISYHMYMIYTCHLSRHPLNHWLLKNRLRIIPNGKFAQFLCYNSHYSGVGQCPFVKKKSSGERYLLSECCQQMSDVVQNPCLIPVYCTGWLKRMLVTPTPWKFHMDSKIVVWKRTVFSNADCWGSMSNFQDVRAKVWPFATG